MRNTKLIACLVTALLSFGASLSLVAADTQAVGDTGSEAAKPPRVQRLEQLKKAAPARRVARQTPGRGPMEKRLQQLRKKKESGKLSDKEQKQLERLEKVNQRHAKLRLNSGGAKDGSPKAASEK